MLVSLVGTLEEGGSPGPMAHNVDSNEAGLDGPAAGVELLRTIFLTASKLLIQQDHACNIFESSLKSCTAGALEFVARSILSWVVVVRLPRDEYTFSRYFMQIFTMISKEFNHSGGLVLENIEGK